MRILTNSSAELLNGNKTRTFGFVNPWSRNSLCNEDGLNETYGGVWLSFKASLILVEFLRVRSRDL